jgi:hypothetical protein
MDREMKYIIFEVTKGHTIHIPVVFHRVLNHKDVSQALLPVLLETFSPHTVKPVSAGFYSLLTGRCTGESTSLDLRHRAEDKEIIEHGIP